MKEPMGISFAFVGLLVGAGFATGLEVVQYFISFGLTGLWGVLISGLVMTAAGAVFLQLGSYFMAEEHHGCSARSPTRSSRAVGRGGLLGGIIYMLLLGLAAFTLLGNIEIIADHDVPMLSLFESMHPAMAVFMSLVIFVEYLKTTGSAVFFVPPGVQPGTQEFIGQALFNAQSS